MFRTDFKRYIFIFGIGLPSSKKILAATGVDPNIRVKDLSEADVQKLRRSP